MIAAILGGTVQAVSNGSLELVIAEIVRVERLRPRPESIELVREKYVDLEDQVGMADRRGILAVHFESSAGELYRSLHGVVRRLNGSWQLTGGASSLVRSASPDDGWSSSGAWTTSGTGVSVGLWLARDDVQVVRLNDPAGRSLVDTVSDGVALFVGEGAFNFMASTVEMLDHRDHLVISRPYQRAT